MPGVARTEFLTTCILGLAARTGNVGSREFAEAAAMMPSDSALNDARQLGPDLKPALLVAAKSAGAMCSKSLRTWRTWDSAGLIPRPVRIGRSTLWSVDELKAWIAAGCPRRAEWEARQ